MTGAETISLGGALTVGDNVATGRPKALQEAQNLGRNRSAGCAGSTQRGCKRGSLDEGTVLGSGREERAALNLFPEVKAGLVPVLGHITEVVADDGPDKI